MILVGYSSLERSLTRVLSIKFVDLSSDDVVNNTLMIESNFEDPFMEIPTLITVLAQDSSRTMLHLDASSEALHVGLLKCQADDVHSDLLKLLTARSDGIPDFEF